jgi:hypothetical protein
VGIWERSLKVYLFFLYFRVNMAHARAQKRR